MLTFSPKLQNYILPFGFAIIIFLMVSTAFLSATRIASTNKTFIENQIEINAINSLLDIMSDANLQRSHILFKLVHNQDSYTLNVLISKMVLGAIRFKKARDKFISYNLSENEKKLLFIQSQMTSENIASVNTLVIHLIDKEYEQAAFVLTNEALPKSKLILDLINQLQITAQEKAQVKAVETKKVSTDVTNNIITVNFVSIFISFMLMLYLIRKQKQSDSNLSKLATTDTLTELPNRDSFINNINQAILKNINSSFSIIFLDIDYFKSINDIYGHEVGDKVLNLFSDSIQNLLSPGDILSRFGGDEFVLLLKNDNQINDVTSVITRLSKELDTSFMIDNNEIFVSASIGASNYPNDGSTAKQLLKNADIAMYAAKQSGRNCFQFFSLENSKRLKHEHDISHALQTILKKKNLGKELFLVYQPLVNIDDNNFNECEALIRWQDENRNTVNTSEFIEIAEKSNLIEKVNMFVIEEACKQQHEWQKQGINNVRININLSGNKRIFSKLFKSLLENLNRYDLCPTLFGIELTERTMYEVSEDTIKDLEHFRGLGMKIAIDDFGTGYSSLSYLKDLPITSLKIDREFITGLPDEKVDVALVKAIITLAHSLDFDVVAEGVETQQQFDFLKSCKCNIAQGYLLHYPLSSDDITKLKLVA